MPGLFEQFPHTNLHELNLDWIIDLINKFKEELEDSAVLSVNGQTGHVTLYESENVILPALPSGVDQWRLVRLMGGQYVGILFYNGHAYIQRGNENMRLLTLEDIPTSSGVVSWNGLTGVVNVTGQDIPVDDAADADSIEQAITNEHTERVNADNALQNSINTLNSKIAILTSWNDTGSGLGSQKVNVPNTWNEINVFVMIDSNTQRCFTFHIIRGQITTGTYVFRDGYYESEANYAYVAITFNFKSDLSVDINMYSAKLTGTDYTRSTAFFVKHKNKAL